MIMDDVVAMVMLVSEGCGVMALDEHAVTASDHEGEGYSCQSQPLIMAYISTGEPD